MSPNTNSNVSWDPSRLRLNQNRVAGSPCIARRGRRVLPIQDRFIAGPLNISWLCRASRLGVKALLVGLALWHIKGLRKADTFIVSNLLLQDWGVLPDAKNRALRKLEKAGLIRVERRGKLSPRVTLVIEKGINGGAFMATVRVDPHPDSEEPADSFPARGRCGDCRQ
jgi:hypothetical protein